jgi:signal transduction histidine kinase
MRNRPALRSVRTRLTVWYVAVLAAVLLTYIVIVFFFQYAVLARQTYHDEIQDIETVEAMLLFDQAGQLHLRQDYFVHPQNRLLVDRLMEVLDSSGQVLYRSETLHGMPLAGAPLRDEGVESFNERTIRLADGSHVALVSHVHPVDGRPVLIRIGYRLQPLEGRMTQFLTLLLLGVPLALIVAAFAGYAVARKALRPLDAMASRAEHITERNLSERLIVENEEDELGHMARIFNHLLSRLERAFAELQRFTADAAHELRTPLASLRTTGELALERNGSAEEFRETISTMLEATAQLNQTIDGLLILARAEARQLGESEEVILLPELVAEILEVIGVVIEERRIHILQELDERARIAVRGDRSFVRVALLNVLHNALKFSPPGSRIRIIYETCMLDDAAAHRICIVDSGPGIQDSEHERIFERFFTSRSESTASHSGTGLGLSIAKLAIERIGGRIFFDKSVTQGACCCIDLPSASFAEGK